MLRACGDYRDLRTAGAAALSITAASRLESSLNRGGYVVAAEFRLVCLYEEVS
jgi:hypothetical protein